MENKEILTEIKKIRMLLEKLTKGQEQINDNIVEIGEELTKNLDRIESNQIFFK